MLGGGVAIGEITECCTEPGVVDARIPVEYVGVAGEAVYIDTEGAFTQDRCWFMAQALVNHIQSCAVWKKRNNKNSSTSNLPSWFTVECILHRNPCIQMS
jgi:hypothetical protein